MEAVELRGMLRSDPLYTDRGRLEGCLRGVWLVRLGGSETIKTIGLGGGDGTVAVVGSSSGGAFVDGTAVVDGRLCRNG